MLGITPIGFSFKNTQIDKHDIHLINMEVLTCIEEENLSGLQEIIDSPLFSSIASLSYEEGLFYIRAAQNKITCSCKTSR